MIRKYWPVAFILAGIVTAIVLSEYFFPAQPPAPPPAIHAEAAPALCYDTMQGKKACLADYQDRFVLINFWATWCAPCIEEFPILLTLARDYPNRLQLVFISSDVSAEVAQRFIDKQTVPVGSNVDYVWDGSRSITTKTFQTLRFPESILINPQGQMVHKVIGPVDETSLEKLHQFLRTN
jgi:thiol-disulfide isomerase/thioredoxin